MQVHEIESFALLCQDPRLYMRRKDVPDDGDRKAARVVLNTNNVEFIQYGGAAEAMGCACEVMASKEAILRAIGVSVKKHKARRGLLTGHTECGAVGLSGHTFEELEKEKAFHAEQLRGIREEVLKAYPELEELIIGFMTVDQLDNIGIEVIG